MFFSTFRVVAATLLAAAAVPAVTQAADSAPSGHEARMPWWREARFGMFIHWGVYAVPAGIHDGKPIGGIGEWILRNAKIPVSEYRAYATRFNPVRYNPGAWMDLAKNAGMKYVVITSKHHDGFALFDSKVSDWDVADATPYKKDLLAPLADAARKRGLKFGLYYSQAQDWIHAGGAKWELEDGGGWDDLQKGSFDSYLKAIAIPQVEEILAQYRPDVLWWDTPHLMNNARAAPLAALVASHPMLITNNRLGGDNPGDTETPEQFIPATGFAGRDWEVCMTMNDTWGYKSDDHNWKSTADLIHKLSDIASKGGNFLLNVGPTAQGEIPAPIIERLKQMGKWMKVNGDAIYGTTASPFNKLPWGRATTRLHDGVATLYLHVWDWPRDGKLLIPGLRSSVKGANLLAGKKVLTTRDTDAGVVIEVPGKAPDAIASVIKLELAGPLDVVEILPRQSGNTALSLTAFDADLHNQLGTDLRLERDNDGLYIGNWTNRRASASWRFTAEKAGKYDVVAELAADAPNALRLAVGAQKTDVVTAPSCGLKKFERVKLGQIVLSAAGKQELSIVPQGKEWKAMNLRSLLLTPVTN